MVSPEKFYTALEEAGIRFFTGVPDSLMKDFLLFVAARASAHIIAVNEGAAVALAAGHHLATGALPLVYLQNSGLGNAVNPLTSLVNSNMYGIPMLLLIGWRGQPGVHDEPQHKTMGAITPAMLQLMDIEAFTLQPGAWHVQLYEAVSKARGAAKPVALLVPAGFFMEGNIERETADFDLDAATVMEHLFERLPGDAAMVCTTGKSGRLFTEWNSRKKKFDTFFLNAGAMGHAGSLAAGLAQAVNRRVVLLDGDGALLMHMGALATMGNLPLPNLTHIVLNNGAHQSVGGQPTAGFSIDACAIAAACGFTHTRRIDSKAALDAWDPGIPAHSKQFVEIRINTRMPGKLPRPDGRFRDAKEAFMNTLQKNSEA